MMSQIPGMTGELARHIMPFLTMEGINAVEVDERAQGTWSVPLSGSTDLTDAIPITLSASHWAAVLAMVRVGTAMSNTPGVGRLAHTEMIRQIQEHRPDLFQSAR